MPSLHLGRLVFQFRIPQRQSRSKLPDTEPSLQYRVPQSAQIPPMSPSPPSASSNLSQASSNCPSVDELNSRTAIHELRDGLKKARVRYFEIHRDFVPAPILKQLVDQNILNVLVQEGIARHPFAEFIANSISQKASKLFSILVEQRKEQDIIHLLDEGITDANLPFVPADTTTHKQSNMALLTRQKKPIARLSEWDNESLKALEVKQYRMLCPKLHWNEHYEFSHLDILPFVEPDSTHPKLHAVGGFGEVFGRFIHDSHHEFGDYTSEKDLPGFPVAVKRVFKPSYFWCERKVFEALSTSSHLHVVKLLFTYRQGDNYHFVFPWANGTLHDFWQQNPLPNHDTRLLMWSLEQMAGIASGLSYFHEFNYQDDHLFGRHGDIKSQNILRFEERDSPGVLKISDFGLSKVHHRDSKSRFHETDAGAQSFLPPEIPRRRVSRKSDIWNLGCLYLEFVTWIVCGYKAILEFSDKRLQDENNPEGMTDYFFSADHENVRPSVISWVGKLKSDPRCSLMMHAVLDLIMTKMIVINLDDRGTAEYIHLKLMAILEQGQSDKNYLLGEL